MSGGVSLVRPLFQTSNIRVIVTDMASGAKTFLSFDQELRESGRTGPRAFGVVRAYELPDQSLVIFGAANARGDTAAVAKLSAHNHWTASPIGPLHESYTVFDAVPTN